MFGEVLRYSRIARKFNQEEFASKIVTPKDYIWELETGRSTNPSRMMVFRLFTGFGAEEDLMIAQALWYTAGYGQLYPDPKITDSDVRDLLKELKR